MTASASPWDGVNALDAAVLAYQGVSVLRQQIHPTRRIHGIIKDGGVAPNIIPASTRMEYYVRSPLQRDLEALYPRVEACFHGAAAQTGCTVTLESGNVYFDVKINQTMSAVYQRYLFSYLFISI